MTEMERIYREIQRVGEELLHTPKDTPRYEQLQEELEELQLAATDALHEYPFWLHALSAMLMVVAAGVGYLMRPVFWIQRWWNLRRKS